MKSQRHEAVQFPGCGITLSGFTINLAFGCNTRYTSCPYPGSLNISSPGKDFAIADPNGQLGTLLQQTCPS